MDSNVVVSITQLLTHLFIFALGLAALSCVALYVIDRTQTRHAIRRNFPVIGRFRYLFEHLGEFFRQYFFAMDREEMPFNRAERSWVYQAAKAIDTTVAFGSSRDLRPPGTILFANDAYPLLASEAHPIAPVTFGPHCPAPYTTQALFHISAMSYGAISKPAVQALGQGAKQAGIWLNTGEGGLSSWHLESGCDLVVQLGTAKYGFRDAEGNLSLPFLAEAAAHPAVRMFELKLSQGAKPGKGGILPAAKVNAEIAQVRRIPVHQDSISPNRHPDIGSAAELLDLIAVIRAQTGKPVGVKTVLGSADWLTELVMEIQLRGAESAPDFITLDGAEGGTGAAPASLIDYMGLPLRESLPLLIDLLQAVGLRHRIKVIAGGKLVTPAQVAWALCVGADCVVSARGFMFALGCIQALQCNKNTCPTGITTHDLQLQRGLVVTDKAGRVNHYARTINKEVEVIAHACGVAEPRQLQRHHCRIVQTDGRSLDLHALYTQRELSQDAR